MGPERPPRGGRAQARETKGRPPCAVPGCSTCRSLRAAAVALAVRRGIQDVTSEAVADDAGIPTELASRHYPTLDLCLTAAFEEGTKHFREVTNRALDREGTWQERLHAAAAATVEALDARPELARFCVIEVWRCNLPTLRASRIAARRRYVDMMTAQRRAGGDEDVPEVRMELLVGAGHHLTGEEIERGDADSLHERLDGLIEVFERGMPSPTA
jgi:AcrR family transcriptional regulator